MTCPPPGRVQGVAVSSEDLAIDWVLDLERRAGRQPHLATPTETGFDIVSDPRRIEVKATGGASSSVWVTGPTLQIARQDPHLFVYVVENVGEGDPSSLRIRVIGAPDLLARLEGPTPGGNQMIPLAGVPAMTPGEALGGPLVD